MQQDQSGQKDYHIAFVPEDDLPADQPWAFIEYDGVMWLAIKEETISARTLEECWETFRKMAAEAD